MQVEFFKKLKMVQDAVASQNPIDDPDYSSAKLEKEYKELAQPLWDSMPLELKAHMDNQWHAMKDNLDKGNRAEAAQLIRETLKLHASDCGPLGCIETCNEAKLYS